MKLLFKLASTILLSQYLGVLADEPKVEEIKAAEEIQPNAEQSDQGSTETMEDLPFDLNE